jgi:hypothetical protein
MRPLTRGGVLLALVCGAWASQGRAQETHIDFRGWPLPLDTKFFGPQAQEYCRVQADGLRLTLPADRPDGQAVGVSFPVRLAGDFDVIARLEVLDAEQPKTGYGVGVLLGVKHSIRIGRLRRAEGDVILWDRNIAIGSGKPVMEGKAFPCSERELRLRLKRQGDTLHFLWAPGLEGGDFQELDRCEFPDDVRLVKLIAQTNKQPCRLDVRVLELRIASGPLAATADSATAPAAPERGRRLWWLLPAVVAVLLAAGVLALRRKPDRTSARK